MAGPTGGTPVNAVSTGPATQSLPSGSAARAEKTAQSYDEEQVTLQADARAPTRARGAPMAAPPPAAMPAMPAGPAPRESSGAAAKVEAAAAPALRDGLFQPAPRPADGHGAPPAPGYARQRTVLLQTCSDTAQRPLYQRRLLWAKRLRTAGSPQELVDRYESAYRACELTDWRAESTFLTLLAQFITSEGTANAVLGYFAAQPDRQRFLARQVLRGAVDPRLVAAVQGAVFGSRIRWTDVDNELAEIPTLGARIERLRQILARVPDDPQGIIRLVRLLAADNRLGEALVQARGLRDAGLTTPLLARELGDLFSRHGLREEAVRTYSEIVEFDPDSLPARRLLGDIYLAHGWYEPAYSQYRTITEATPDDALGWLRLAAAAAGAGRSDEALRIERRVAAAPGSPGPTDPRRWAKLLSATRLAQMIASPPRLPEAAGNAATDPARLVASLQGKLKELQLFRGPGTLEVLRWEDLSADVQLATMSGKDEVLAGEVTDAAPIGLSAVLLPGDAAGRPLTLRAHLRSPALSQPVTLQRYEIRWDGKAFTVKQGRIVLPEKSSAVDLAAL